MKPAVYKHKDSSGLDIEIYLTTNRDLTENDNTNIRECVDTLISKINEETIKIDPKSKQQAIRVRQEIISLFNGKDIFVDEIPNEYCNSYCCKHLNWFIITTKLGRIKIGWRKRVIHIEWTDSTITETAEELFPFEDVTKHDRIIHAWSVEKAQEYINRLFNKTTNC